VAFLNFAVEHGCNVSATLHFDLIHIFRTWKSCVINTGCIMTLLYSLLQQQLPLNSL
jgi:hypothetical protein